MQKPRLSLSDEGHIFWQADPTNPLPGEHTGQVVKGESLLAPVAEVSELSRAGEVQEALLAHIGDVLAPLVALEQQEGEGPVAKIARALYAAGGIVPRELLEDEIAKLDADMRGALRALKIRLGPILVFMPDLNKPAAVKMKALLWNVYHEKPLPAFAPPDGVVSKALPEGMEADPDYFRMIGYPLYGGRMVRIDMLDRVISAVYDAADKGKFQAQHQMAEWLGCPIAGLYDVLTDMGHVKIHDPAEEARKNPDAAAKAAEAAAPEESAEEAPEGETVPAEKKEENIKPELATFRLKKGKASEKASAPAAEKPKKISGKRRSQPKVKNKDKNKARVMSAGPEKKPEDSPFAILAQLKDKS